MNRGYYRIGRGRCNAACLIVVANSDGSAKIKKDEQGPEFWVAAKDVVAINDNYRFVSVSWAGGWDEYVVDVTQVRELTEYEKAEEHRIIAAKTGLFPEINRDNGNWLLGRFSRFICQDHQCVKIVRRIQGGD